MICRTLKVVVSLFRVSFAGFICTASIAAATGVAPDIATISAPSHAIRVGSDHTFQIVTNSSDSVARVHPATPAGTADMGWIVAVGGVNFAADFTLHPGGTSTFSVGPTTPWQRGSLSPVTGTGTLADPFKISVTNALPDTDLSSRQDVTYVTGDALFRKEFVLINSGASPVFARVFLGADFSAPITDGGQARLNTVGEHRSDCGVDEDSISLLAVGPLPPTARSLTGYNALWSEIRTGSLSNAVTTDCRDVAAALQWDLVVPAHGSTSIEAATAIGRSPSAAQFSSSR